MQSMNILMRTATAFNFNTHINAATQKKSERVQLSVLLTCIKICLTQVFELRKLFRIGIDVAKKMKTNHTLFETRDGAKQRERARWRTWVKMRQLSKEQNSKARINKNNGIYVKCVTRYYTWCNDKSHGDKTWSKWSKVKFLFWFFGTMFPFFFCSASSWNIL